MSDAMKRDGRLRSIRGMTLIEVLVASVLLGVGVVGLVSVASLAMRNQQRTEQRASALYLAQEKLADVERVGAHIWMLGHPTRGGEERDGVVYEWTIQIDQLAVGELSSVLIAVRWAGPGGSGTIELETWLNDYEAVAPLTAEPGEQAAPGVPQFSPPR